jgi:hypothetical protein
MADACTPPRVFCPSVQRWDVRWSPSKPIANVRSLGATAGTLSSLYCFPSPTQAVGSAVYKALGSCGLCLATSAALAPLPATVQPPNNFRHHPDRQRAPSTTLDKARRLSGRHHALAPLRPSSPPPFTPSSPNQPPPFSPPQPPTSPPHPVLLPAPCPQPILTPTKPATSHPHTHPTKPATTIAIPTKPHRSIAHENTTGALLHHPAAAQAGILCMHASASI